MLWHSKERRAGLARANAIMCCPVCRSAAIAGKMLVCVHVQVAPNADVAMEANVQAGAQELVDRAMNPVNLSRMDPTWHPWF